MREIKFRAWDGKKMHDGVQPLLDNVNPTQVMVPDGSILFVEPTGNKRYWYEIDVQAIMQYSGIKDKNRKEIYEGDALKSHEVRLADPDKVMFVKVSRCTFVIYNPDCCDVCRNGDGCIGPLDAWPDNTFEVIGNIYENFKK